MLASSAFAAALSFVTALALGRVVIACGLMDAPSSVRKAHATPTPTAGGLSFGIAFAIALAAASMPSLRGWADALAPDDVNRLLWTVIAAMVLLIIGVVDDMRPLAAKPKFALMTLIAFLYAAFVARAPGLPITAHVVLDFGMPFAIAGSALFYFTLVNTSNFMDGANGLAIGCIAIGLCGLSAIGWAHGAPQVGLASLIAAAGMAGFLVWNFPKGRLFAGDAGSLFAGGIAAGLSLIAVQYAGVSPFIPPMLFFPLLADVLLTLAWRVKQQRNALRAHRDHLFQLGLRAGLSHRRVTLTYWFITVHCVLVAFLASFGPRIAVGGESRLADAPIFYQAAAWAAALAPVASLTVLAIIAVKVSTRLRAFAKMRGYDSE